jgi:hypothetical protein
MVAFKIWTPSGPSGEVPRTATPKPGPVRAEIRVFPVMPWALKPMIASNPSLYWLLLRAENHSGKPVQLDVRCEVLNEPPVATCAKQPWSISLVAGQKKDEKIDPRLTFLSTAGPDTDVDRSHGESTTEARRRGGPDVSIKIPPRHSTRFKDAAARSPRSSSRASRPGRRLPRRTPSTRKARSSGYPAQGRARGCALRQHDGLWAGSTRTPDQT